MCIEMHSKPLASLGPTMKVPVNKIESDEEGNLLYVFLDESQTWQYQKIGNMLDHWSSKGCVTLNFNDISTTVRVPVKTNKPRTPGLFESAGLSIMHKEPPQ